MRRAGDAPGEAEIRDDLLAQRQRPANVGIAEVRLGDRPRRFGRQRRPQLARERVQCGQSALQRQRRRGRRRHAAARGPGRVAPAPSRARSPATEMIVPGRAPRLDRALAGQQVVGRVDRAARDAQLRGKRAGRGKPRAGRQRPDRDGRPQPRGDLQVEWPRLPRVESDHGPVNQPISGPG